MENFIIGYCLNILTFISLFYIHDKENKQRIIYVNSLFHSCKPAKDKDFDELYIIRDSYYIL